MKRTLVKNIPANAISREELLQRRYPLVAFEIIDKPGAPPQAVGTLVPVSYFNRIGCESVPGRYVARSARGFGYGNGWGGDKYTGDYTEGKTLVEWLDWFNDLDRFQVHVFDSEKELFFFLAEKSK